MLFAQGNSIKLVHDFSERLIHVHCKDIRKNVLDKSLKNDSTFRQAFLDGAFTVPGDGCIDYVPFLKALKEKNYSGWCSCKQNKILKKLIHLNMQKLVTII